MAAFNNEMTRHDASAAIFLGLNYDRHGGICREAVTGMTGGQAEKAIY